jgi:glycosyltransferase involved in cell wall biosynthesis
MFARSTPIDVLFLNWRDLSHPEGGGSERYVHRIAEGLAAAGLRVTLLCAAHDRAPAEEMVRGVRVVRRGGRLGVYPRALAYVLGSRPRMVVDVQNGVPFCSPLVTRAPVTVLVHHVHREQWPIVFGRLGGKVGWWLESVLAPRVYRRSRYVTVSQATRAELAGLGVAAERVTVVPNGVEPVLDVPTPRSATPRLVVVGRLVPHKQVEHAVQVLARLRDGWPGIRLAVVGEGWWEDRLRAEAERLGVADLVEFTGYLDEPAKHAQLASAWVHLCPSVKEGWGLVVTEAGGHRVPTVGYRSAGGLRESVVDGVTGVLVDDLDQMTAAVDRLLADEELRRSMGAAAARHAAGYDWTSSVRGFAGVLSAAAGDSAGAVGHDLVDHLLLALLDGRAAGGVDDHRDGADGGGPYGSAAGQREEDGDQGLHSGTHFLEGVRRSGTVDEPNAVHNRAQLTAPSATA